MARTVVPLLGLALALVFACLGPEPQQAASGLPPSREAAPGFSHTHFDEVQKAEYCARCHPAEVAEHRANTHGRAFADPEARMATGRFSLGSCIDCHTPRPVFETGIGMNPIKRLHHLEEGNSCLTCHQRGGYDMARFQGGAEDCRAAFDPRVGTVEACASCHKNHGTPYQWEHAAHGKKAGRLCIDCHMPTVVRPPAAGREPRRVRRHTFFAGHSESQIRRAYAYEAKLEGNEVLVTVENRGVGHNFPTELKQRSVESLVVVRDPSGKEVARSRKVFRDPYKRPYGLSLPVNTQIPSGETREHRVPLPLAEGIAETTLFFKQYYPIEDYHPNLSLTLESRALPFSGLTPSDKPVDPGPEIHAALPEAIPVEAASPANLADFPHPKIGKVEVDIPDGTREGDVETLIGLFQFPVPEANRKALDVLVSLGPKAVPALIDALGSWDNKTWSQAQAALVRIQGPAKGAVLEALEDPRLYVRFHAREVVPRMGLREAAPLLTRTLRSPHPLDRRGAAWALGEIGARDEAGRIQGLLRDQDPDVVVAAALSLARLEAREASEALRETLRLWPMSEVRRDLAYALAALGDPEGIPVLIDLLDHPDDLIRESVFELFFAVTGRHEGYHPLLEPKERLHAVARLRHGWEREPSLRPPRLLPPEPLRGEIQKHVTAMGGNDFFPDEPAESQKALNRLVEIGSPALLQVLQGFKWPSGFARKRAMLCQYLIAVPDPDAVPWLLALLEDPVMEVALWAVQALEVTGDPSAVGGVKKFQARLDSLKASGKLPASLGSGEAHRVAVARALLRLGEEKAADTLLACLWTGDGESRRAAEQALRLFCDEMEQESPTRVAEIQAQLERIAERQAVLVEDLRLEWERRFEEASRRASEAKTAAEAFEALRLFDAAEEGAAALQALDPQLFLRILRDTAFGAEEAAQRVYEDLGYEAAAPWKEVPLEPGSPPWLPGPWRDYVLEAEFTVDGGAVEVLHRHDPAKQSGLRLRFEPGKSYSVRQRLVGNSVTDSRAEGGGSPSVVQNRVGLGVRKGGVLFSPEEGAKLSIHKLRIQVLR